MSNQLKREISLLQATSINMIDMVGIGPFVTLPLVIGLTQSAVESVDPALRLQVRALGATPAQVMWAVLREARAGVLAAVLAAFGSVISEVGAVMLVGTVCLAPTNQSRGSCTVARRVWHVHDPAAAFSLSSLSKRD